MVSNTENIETPNIPIPLKGVKCKVLDLLRPSSGEGLVAGGQAMKEALG